MKKILGFSIFGCFFVALFLITVHESSFFEAFVLWAGGFLMVGVMILAAWLVSS